MEKELIEALNKYPQWEGLEEVLDHEINRKIIKKIVSRIKKIQNDTAFEMRTPLTASLGYMNVLKESKDWENLSNNSKECVIEAEKWVNYCLEFIHSDEF